MADYSINYDDERFVEVEQDKQQALTDVENTYGGMISEADKYYQAQIDASKEWADKQSQLQQENTDFLIEKVEQDKAQAQKDYTKEQSGAYVDWQKQSNQFGANAEQMAMNGMANTGYSESSMVSMYNTYQNRVATARESYNKAVLNYDNNIKEAILQNNSKLAEISYQALQTQLQLALEGFQYKNNLLLEQMNKKQEVDNQYYNRYQDVLAQMNQENALAEEIRQFEANYELQVKEYEEQIRQFNEEMERLKKKDAEEHALELEKLELQKKQLEEEKRQFDQSYALQKQQLSASKSSSSKSSSSGSSGNASITKTETKTYAVNTAYYQGDLNVDAKLYGTFSNGYQPKGIFAHGTLKKTGDTITFNTQTLSGQKQTVTQNIWKAEDGTKWYWDGRYNKYIQCK